MDVNFQLFLSDLTIGRLHRTNLPVTTSGHWTSADSNPLLSIPSSRSYSSETPIALQRLIVSAQKILTSQSLEESHCYLSSGLRICTLGSRRTHRSKQCPQPAGTVGAIRGARGERS